MGERGRGTGGPLCRVNRVRNAGARVLERFYAPLLLDDALEGPDEADIALAGRELQPGLDLRVRARGGCMREAGGARKKEEFGSKLAMTLGPDAIRTTSGRAGQRGSTARRGARTERIEGQNLRDPSYSARGEVRDERERCS